MLELKYNESSENFETIFEASKKPIKVKVCDFERDSIVKASELTSKVLAWFREKEDSIYDITVTNYLVDLKNESWLEENEEEISKKEFISRIKIEGISVFADGNFEVWFSDGDIFWGHWIRADFSEKFEFIESAMC